MALRTDDVDLERDRMLVQRFQEGDDTAFEILYRQYVARLQRFCLKRVGDPHDAEEIAQEAFARAYRALPRFGGDRRFYPWMTVIAGRLCVDHHRCRARTEPSENVDLGGVEGGQEAIVQRAELATLGEALERLAPRHREVLGMRECEGRSYQQIAEHYGVPVGTVEALLFRARRALRREFFALAGSDRLGGLAPLPLVGAGLRRWAEAKAKVAAWASALPPAIAPAFGVAAVVGSAAVVGIAVPPQPIEHRRALRGAITTSTTTSTVRGLGAAPTPVQAVRAVAPAARRPAASSAPDRIESVVAGHVLATNAALRDYDSPTERAEEQVDLVVRVDVGGGEVVVTLHPDGVVGDVLTSASPPGGSQP